LIKNKPHIEGKIEMQSTPTSSIKEHDSNKVWHRFKQEPLLIFMAIALLIFVGDYLMSLTKEDPNSIVITTEIRQEAKQIYINSFKQEPSEKDMKILMDRWIDNEVLYREGVALGLDKGDSSIRERVIFKALSVTQASINLPKLDENGLQNWFKEHADQYDAPSLVHFQEAVPSGKTSADDLKIFVNALNGKGKSNIDSSLEIFKDRPRFNIVDGYGEEFTAALEKLPTSGWHLLDSKAGPRIVSLISVKEGEKADFEEVKAKVYADWKNQTGAEMSTKAIRDMGKKYTIIDHGDKQ
jgi:hypothetical protein